MSDTPKFEVIDRRKYKGDDEHESAPKPAPQPPAATAAPAAAPSAGPRLVVAEPPREPEPAPAEEAGFDEGASGDMPPPPTAAESKEQKTAYDASARRLDDLIRAQNPAMGAPPPLVFEQLVQQFYVSAMIQMGAGTQEGQRPRVDILGARQTIDMLGLLAEKTRGNLTADEDRVLQTVLFDVRMAFLELSNMIAMQGIQAPPPPPPGKR